MHNYRVPRRIHNWCVAFRVDLRSRASKVHDRNNDRKPLHITVFFFFFLVSRKHTYFFMGKNALSSTASLIFLYLGQLAVPWQFPRNESMCHCDTRCMGALNALTYLSNYASSSTLFHRLQSYIAFFHVPTTNSLRATRMGSSDPLVLPYRWRAICFHLVNSNKLRVIQLYTLLGSACFLFLWRLRPAAI